MIEAIHLILWIAWRSVCRECVGMSDWIWWKIISSGENIQKFHAAFHHFIRLRQTLLLKLSLTWEMPHEDGSSYDQLCRCINWYETLLESGYRLNFFNMAFLHINNMTAWYTQLVLCEGFLICRFDSRATKTCGPQGLGLLICKKSSYPTQS